MDTDIIHDIDTACELVSLATVPSTIPASAQVLSASFLLLDAFSKCIHLKWLTQWPPWNTFRTLGWDYSSTAHTLHFQACRNIFFYDCTYQVYGSCVIANAVRCALSERDTISQAFTTTSLDVHNSLRPIHILISHWIHHVDDYISSPQSGSRPPGFSFICTSSRKYG